MSNSIISDILVFKTSLCSKQDIGKIASILDDDQRIRNWNVDHEDVDHILRVESRDHDPDHIIRLMTSAGIFCEELPD